MDSSDELHDIVIVGGGICGLATALALHRKGFRSIVLEKSDSLRATGAAIGVFSNGWRALDQLGVGSQLRQTAIPMERTSDVWIDKGKQQEIVLTSEARCLKRSDLVKSLADALPPGSIHFGCQIASVKMDTQTNYPSLQLYDGKTLIAKVLIGCDGSNSMVAEFLQMRPTRQFAIGAIRGLTSYPNGHKLPHEFIRMRRGKILAGQIPITDNLVYWFIGKQLAQSDAEFPHDPEVIKRSAIELQDGFPSEFQELVDGSELDSLSFTHLRYRAPWDLLLGQFRRGAVTVAGDAMHVMGPFLGQGGSAAIEDALVLARNLAQKISPGDLHQSGRHSIIDKVGAALDQYLKERRMRLVLLSTQSYLSGVLFETVSVVKRFIAIIFMATLFRDPIGHTKYDCGPL